jgi:hypothetical protein
MHEELEPTSRPPSKYSVAISYLYNSSLNFLTTVFTLALSFRVEEFRKLYESDSGFRLEGDDFPECTSTLCIGSYETS